MRFCGQGLGHKFDENGTFSLPKYMLEEDEENTRASSDWEDFSEFSEYVEGEEEQTEGELEENLLGPEEGEGPEMSYEEIVGYGEF